MQARKVRVADIERLRHTMQRVPEHRTEEVTTAEAVRMLAPEIRAMRSKGYDLSAIAELLSDNGLALTPNTLKTYLGDARAGGAASQEQSTPLGDRRGSHDSDDGIEARGQRLRPFGTRRARSASRHHCHTRGDDAADSFGDAGGLEGGARNATGRRSGHTEVDVRAEGGHEGHLRAGGIGATTKETIMETKEVPTTTDGNGVGRLYWLGESKGGVGKSMMTLGMLDYLHEQAAKVVLVQGDTSSPDVWKALARKPQDYLRTA
jgi:hypothetical protein